MADRSGNEAPCPVCGARRDELAPPDYRDPVIDVHIKDVDRTLPRENLKRTVEQRALTAQSFHESIARWRGAAAGTSRPHPNGGEGA
jgi:hypothetical protein